MIKINYKNPEPTELSDNIAIENIIISDKFKKADYLEISCISWLKLDSNRDYQDLECLFRSLNLDSHLIAQSALKIKIPEDLEINFPNEKIITEPLKYIIKISCKKKEDAINELLLYHTSYEENYNCLKTTGCLMVKKKDKIDLELNKKMSEDKNILEITKILECKLKLDFTYFKPTESLNYIIDDIIARIGKTPEKKVCGEINGNKFYGLTINNEIISPIGWIEKENIKNSDIEEVTQNIELNEKYKNIINCNSNSVEFELIDLRTIKIEKN